MSRLGRRELCASIAVAGTGVLGGCGRFGGPATEFSLFTGKEGLASVFLLRESYGGPHIYRHAETLRTALAETGSVETLEATVDGGLSHPDRGEPESGARPTFLEADGYHRLGVGDATPTTVEEWVVWFEPVESAPDDASPIDEWRSELGSFDTSVLDRATTALGTALSVDEVPSDRPLRDRGFVLFDPLTVEETTLAPDPPFEYAVFEGEESFLPDEQPVRLHVERGAVETTRYTTVAERIADDRPAFESYLAANVLDAVFTGDDLTDNERAVLERARRQGYRETADTPSEPFRTVLERLGVDTFEHDGDRSSRALSYRYDGTHYGATYTVE